MKIWCSNPTEPAPTAISSDAAAEARRERDANIDRVVIGIAIPAVRTLEGGDDRGQRPVGTLVAVEHDRRGAVLAPASACAVGRDGRDVAARAGKDALATHGYCSPRNSFRERVELDLGELHVEQRAGHQVALRVVPGAGQVRRGASFGDRGAA